VDGAHEKETRARETIQQLKLEISNLSKLVEQGAGLTMGQEHRYDGQIARSKTGQLQYVLIFYYLFSLFFYRKKLVSLRAW
jgi:hypothetical protein